MNTEVCARRTPARAPAVQQAEHSPHLTSLKKEQRREKELMALAYADAVKKRTQSTMRSPRCYSAQDSRTSLNMTRASSSF
jgi:hypothetical protein